MEIKTTISNVSQEKLKKVMRPISRNTSTYVFKLDYSLLTILSINGVPDFVIGPRIIVLLLSGNLVDFWISTYHFFMPMEANLSICSSSVG